MPMELSVLDRWQSLDLLHTVPIGRLVYTEMAVPAVHPVNFRLHDNDVVIRVAGGGKLAAAINGFVVAFQADQIDMHTHAGWAVTVVGHCALISDADELVDVAGTWIEPWAPGPRTHFIRIRTQKVDGRRLAAPPTGRSPLPGHP